VLGLDRLGIAAARHADVDAAEALGLESPNRTVATI
jgi:hypothetical protein